MAVSGTVSGPTLLDDYIQVTTTNSFTAGLAAWGRVDLLGGTSWTCYLDDNTLAIQGVADGATVTMQIEARHVGGTVFDSVTYLAAFANDPNTGLTGLIRRHSGHDAMLDAILAAVRKTF